MHIYKLSKAQTRNNRQHLLIGFIVGVVVTVVVRQLSITAQASKLIQETDEFLREQESGV